MPPALLRRCIDGLSCIADADCLSRTCRDGKCRPACEPEQCNNFDDDCDGEADNGVKNACGECGPLPEEVCNNRDDNCNDRIDDGAKCPSGQTCSSGQCRTVCGDKVIGGDEECEPAVDGWTQTSCNPNTCQRTQYRPCQSQNDCDFSRTCEMNAKVCIDTCVGATSTDPQGVCPTLPGFDRNCFLDICMIPCKSGTCPKGLVCATTSSNEAVRALFADAVERPLCVGP